MSFQVTSVSELLVTKHALARLVTNVGYHMFIQVAAPRELLLTESALVRLVTTLD